MSKILRAYHSDSVLKESTVAQMRAHREADELVSGMYWSREGKKKGKGCAVGCLTHEADGGHALFPEKWGIPVRLAYLEDRIFEGLARIDDGSHLAWPERFLSAIPVGADLRRVWPDVAVWLMHDPAHGVRRFAKKPDVLAVIDRAAEWWKSHDEAPTGDSSWRSDAWRCWAAAAAAAAAAAEAAEAAAAAAEAEAEAEGRSWSYWGPAAMRARASYWKALADFVVSRLQASPVEAPAA